MDEEASHIISSVIEEMVEDLYYHIAENVRDSGWTIKHHIYVHSEKISFVWEEEKCTDEELYRMCFYERYGMPFGPYLGTYYYASLEETESDFGAEK
ncbi:MAG: hypothetical protein ACRDAX_08475 [Propionibacteriaceae bacterium]